MIKQTNIVVEHFNSYNFYQFITVKYLFGSMLYLGLSTFSFIITSLIHIYFLVMCFILLFLIIYVILFYKDFNVIDYFFINNYLSSIGIADCFVEFFKSVS